MKRKKKHFVTSYSHTKSELCRSMRSRANLYFSLYYFFFEGSVNYLCFTLHTLTDLRNSLDILSQVVELEDDAFYARQKRLRQREEELAEREDAFWAQMDEMNQVRIESGHHFAGNFVAGINSFCTHHMSFHLFCLLQSVGWFFFVCLFACLFFFVY